MDGLIGALYVIAMLKTKIKKTMIETYQIGTEEYDFIKLKRWFKRSIFSKCVFLDVSIENNPDTLSEIQMIINGKIFVYDHHILTAKAVDNSSIIVANPTPQKLNQDEVPIPTFLFALYLAIEGRFLFPDWLLLTAIFAEGVDSFFPEQIEELFYSVFGQKVSKQNQRKEFRKTKLAKISPLIRAGFSDRYEGQNILKLFSIEKFAHGFSELIEDLTKRYLSLSTKISEIITESVDHLIEDIRNNYANDKVILIPIDSYPSVVGPIASILRQYYPDKVFLSYLHNENNVMFEIRVSNNSPIDLVSILTNLSDKVTFYNFGGHSMAAGGLLKKRDLNSFLSLFVAEFKEVNE